MNRYNEQLDRVIAHDYPGVHSINITQFILDEIELGARVAVHLDDPFQTFYALEDLLHLMRVEQRNAKT